MKKRPYWISKIEKAWQKRPIVWLTGVRRVGKTTLSKMFEHGIYLNCDLPSVQRRLEDPEFFFREIKSGSIVVFDEVHRLQNPSQVLKIAADEFADLKIIATGSSTLAATKKFRDSLTGRKTSIFLPPVIYPESSGVFGIKELDRRLLHGGLPELLLSDIIEHSFYAEWIDSFYARDISELFSIRNRSGFLKLLSLLLRQSGSLIDYSNLAKHSELSRPTVKAYIEALIISNAAFLLPPFSGGGRREITKQPKCYCFDTGFVCFNSGWETIRAEDRGILWEHLVLDVLRTTKEGNSIFFWRDKSGREIDFIIKRGIESVDAIECKMNPDNFNFDNLSEFRRLYPYGKNYCISPYVVEKYRIKKRNLVLEFIPLNYYDAEMFISQSK